MNLPLSEVRPSISTPPPTEELAIEEPSQAQSSHPDSLLESSSEVDAFAALQDEDRPDHLDYEDDTDVMLETNQLEQENRAYAGSNLPPSGEVINADDSDTDAEANRSLLFY